MKLTKAQKKVVDRLKEIGGMGWLGTAVNKTTNCIDANNYHVSKVLIRDFFGQQEVERLQREIKKYGITRRGCWCSNKVFSQLLNAGIIEPVEEVSGVFRLVRNDL